MYMGGLTYPSQFVGIRHAVNPGSKKAFDLQKNVENSSKYEIVIKASFWTFAALFLFSHS